MAEQVAKVNPDLVARDDQGKPYTVRYEAVNAMLLNEFLKEHRKVEEHRSQNGQSKINQRPHNSRRKCQAAERSASKAQASQIQKVSDQVEASKPAPQMVAENR